MSTIRANFQGATKTILLTQGQLLDLDHTKTALQFIAYARESGKLMPGATLDLATLQKLMPQILKLDGEYRAGRIESATFRQSMLDILKLNLNDAEFDHAWCAMLGDISKLKARLQQLKENFPAYKLIVLSMTDTIHMQKIFDTLGLTNISFRFGREHAQLTSHELIPRVELFVSFESDKFAAQQNEMQASVAFIEQIIKFKNLSARQTQLVWQTASQSQFAKQRDEKNAHAVECWAQVQHLHLIDRRPGEEVTDAIQRDFRQNAGLKLHAGAPTLWSFARKQTTPELSLSANVVQMRS